MSRRALFVLLGLLAALGVIAALGTLGQRTVGGEETVLLPELKSRLNDLTGVTIKGAGGATVATLVRNEAGWEVAEKGYPADLGRLRRNLVALADATLVEEKTSNPELYSRLGVEDITAASARGLQLDLAGPADAPTLSLIVGDTGVSGGKLAYARRAGEATSWLVAADLDPGRTAAEWLDRQILDVPAARVHEVIIRHPDGAVLELRKDSRDQENFTVVNLPQGRSLNFEGVADGIGAVLSALSLDDVEPRAVLGDNPGKPVVARFRTFDGLVVEVSAWRLDQGTRLTFSTSTDQSLADRFAVTDPDPDPANSPTNGAGDGNGDGDPETPKPLAFAAVVKEAEAINARTVGWVYTVPSFKTEQLTRRVEDLSEPTP